MDTTSVNKFRENLKSFVERVVGQHVPLSLFYPYTESDLQEMRDINHKAETILNNRQRLNSDGIAIQAATAGVV